MQIYDKNGGPLLDAVLDDQSKRDSFVKRVLMGDHYIQIAFNTSEHIEFPKGSYLLHEGLKFEIMAKTYPEPNGTTGGYRHTLRFEAQQSHMKKHTLFWREGPVKEAVFHDTTTLADFAHLVAGNMNAALGVSTWSEGVISAENPAMAKLVSFNGDKCWNACTLIAEAFGVEWWTEQSDGGVRICFGKLEFGSAEEFRPSDAVQQIPARKGEDSTFGTRFYVFGSKRNLTKEYGQAQQGGTTNHISEVRLRLPDGREYIDAREDLAPEEVVEQVVVFEDIYPKNTDIVSRVETSAGVTPGNTACTLYTLCADDAPFVPSDLMKGETLRLTFDSGTFSGREFEVQIDADPETWTPDKGFNRKFTLVPQTEDAGKTEIVIPNESLHPKAGDKFILTGVKLPAVRIAEAEAELLAAGETHALKNSRDTDVYDCHTNPVFCRQNNKNYELGQRVVLTDPTHFGPDGRQSRIQAYEKNLANQFEATYTVGDNTAYSRLAAAEKTLREASYAERIGVADNGKGIYLVTRYDKTQSADTNAYSALRSDFEFLNKRRGGVVEGDVRFTKDVSVGGDLVTGDFVQNGFAGSGAGIYTDASGQRVLEVDKIVARRSLDVNEVIINQVSHVGGRTIYSAANMECVKVENGGTFYQCYFDTKDGQRANLWKEGDQAYCQCYSADGTQLLKYYWRRVTSVEEEWIRLSATDCDGEGIPTEGDNIVQIGSRTDPKRQAVLEIDQMNGGRVVQYAGIGSFNFVNRNEVAFGVNGQGKPFFYAYGEMFIGDRDLTDPDATFLTFQTAEGEDRPRLRICADVQFGGGSTGLTNLSEWAAVQQMASEAKNSVDNLQIGGVNLALNTTKDRRWDYWGDDIVSRYLLSDNTPSDEPLIIRFTTKDILGDPIMDFGIGWGDASSWSGSYFAIVKPIEGKTMEFKVSKPKQYSALWIYFNNYVTVHHLNVQSGNKPADWSPAPEDVQTQIDKAQADAGAAQAQLADIASDNKFTPSEKQAALEKWHEISLEYPTHIAQAQQLAVDTGGYTNAFALLRDYLTPLISDLRATSDINGPDFRWYFTNYYNARVELLKVITDASSGSKRRVEIDATGLDQNTYYPVTLILSKANRSNIRLYTSLGISGVPNWAGHPEGFSCSCSWSSIGSGWGTSYDIRYTEEFFHRWTQNDILPIGSIGQIGEYSYEYIYVRGGGKYYIEATNATEIVLHTSGWAYQGWSIPLRSSVEKPVVDIERLNKGLSDVERLKEAFKDGSTYAKNGVVLSDFIGIKDGNNVVAAMTSGGKVGDVNLPLLFAGADSLLTAPQTALWSLDKNGTQKSRDADGNTVTINNGGIIFEAISGGKLEQTTSMVPREYPVSNDTITAFANSDLLGLPSGSFNVDTPAVSTDLQGYKDIPLLIDTGGPLPLTMTELWNTVIPLSATFSVGSDATVAVPAMSFSASASVSYSHQMASDLPFTEHFVFLYLCHEATGHIYPVDSHGSPGWQVTTLAASVDLLPRGDYRLYCRSIGGAQLITVTHHATADCTANIHIPASSFHVSWSSTKTNSKLFGNGFLFSRRTDQYCGIIGSDTEYIFEQRSGNLGFRADSTGSKVWCPSRNEWIPADRVLYKGWVRADATIGRWWAYKGDEIDFKLKVSKYSPGVYIVNIRNSSLKAREDYLVRCTGIGTGYASDNRYASPYYVRNGVFHVITVRGNDILDGDFFFEVVDITDMK